MIKLDDIDLKILRELSENSNQSVKEIAAKVNLSVTPVHDRIKKIETAGIVKKYAALLDAEQLGYNLITYIQIRLIRHQEKMFEDIALQLRNMEEVMEAAFTAGEFDLIVKLLFKDMNDYHDFVLHKMSKLEAISYMKTSFAIRFISGNQHLINPKLFKL